MQMTTQRESRSDADDPRLPDDGAWRSLVARRLGRRGRWFESSRPDWNGGHGTDPQRPGRLKPILLAAAMAFLALNVWTGSPLLAVWLGSKVQGEESQPSMGAYAVVILSLIAFSWGLYQLLKLAMGAYQDATGTAPTVRSHAPWMRSMRDERHEHAASTTRISSAERIVVVTVLVAATAFEIWFFFFSGSSIGGGGGR